MNHQITAKGFEYAKEAYASVGVDVEKALKRLSTVSLSLHCWQGDDVGGFEKAGAQLKGGGIQVTGNHPGKARSIAELQEDLEKVFSLLPGKHRLNLHAIYGDFSKGFVDRDRISIDQFETWISWAKKIGIGLDFNPTCFSHPMAASGFTLSSKDPNVRRFWIDHVQKCRAIAAHMGKELGTPCINNIWIPDGMKDIPVDRMGHRKILKESLDEIFSVTYPASQMKDALECKLFGIGSESCVVGSHEFYMGYGIRNKKMLCFDMGHFHPTESVADKISSILLYQDDLLLHVSRGVRWDSDHVVTLNDDLLLLAQELVRCEALPKVNIALDFFDGTLNRIGAWSVGARATQKALLYALLEPTDKIRVLEEKGDNYSRLQMLESQKTLPFGAVWDQFCAINKVPGEQETYDSIMAYEREVLAKR